MIRFLFFIYCTSFFPLILFASVSACGNYTAVKPCPAYKSLKHRDNPGNIYLVIGESYQVKSVIKAVNWDWIYVLVEGAKPKARWIAADCGKGEIEVSRSTNRNRRDSIPAHCRVSNTYDSNVLAVSWQPGFCENIRPDNLECVAMYEGDFQVHYFTLHGLWPNKKGCGINYGKCSAVKADLEPTTIDILDDYMPSLLKGNTWLMNHEWEKHGTCQSLNDDDYFLLSVKIVKQFNASPVGVFITDKIKQTIVISDLAAHIEKTMGYDLVDRFNLDCDCKNGNLIEIKISLPRDISIGRTLAETMRGAKPLVGGLKGDCGNRFYVEHAGPQ